MKKIKNIMLSNWRSFKTSDKPQLENLKKFNVIIGPNSSGKTNIACGIRFALGWGHDYGYQRAGGNIDLRIKDYNNQEEKIKFLFQFTEHRDISVEFPREIPKREHWFFPVGPNKVAEKLLHDKENKKSIKLVFDKIKEHAEEHFGITINGTADNEDIYLSDVSDENKVPFIENGGGNVFVIYFLSELLKQLNKFDVFLIDEPEVHMHAGLQRTFLKYILHLIKDYDKQFIITTHSPVFIDQSILSKEDQHAIFKVSKPDKYSEVKNITSDASALKEVIVNNLGNKPSDIFHANGVIWVEGVSDAIYLRKWLELYDENKFKQYLENIHYIIISYGGQIETTDFFKSKKNTEHLIQASQVNNNFFIIIDGDQGPNDGGKWDNKKKVRDNFNINGKYRVWITSKYATIKYKDKPPNSTIEGYLPERFRKYFEKNKKNNVKKTDMAKRIINEMNKDPKIKFENVDDLECLMNELYSNFESWNS